MKHKFDIIFLPLHREIGDIIASEVYWAMNTFEMIAKDYRSRAYVGRISQSASKHLGKLSDNISSYGIDSSQIDTPAGYNCNMICSVYGRL